jgi:hypothetical protein
MKRGAGCSLKLADQLGFMAAAGRYCRVVIPVPFKKKAKAVFPSLEAVGADGLLPNVNSNPPAASPAIKYAHHREYQHAISAGRRIKTAHLSVQELAVAAIHIVLDPASRV